MTSKEALENLYNMACVEAGQKQQFITYAREIEHNENVKKHYDIIKQDLERLEMLEKENKQHIKNVRMQIGQKTLLSVENARLQQENEKLKKAIEILKEKPEVLEFGLENFEWDEYTQYYCYFYEWTEFFDDEMEYKSNEFTLTQQEYELLKEVLEWV